MSHLDIIRAWKDPEYRLSLSGAERALLPAHPAGLIELTDAQLDQVGGGSVVLPAWAAAAAIGVGIFVGAAAVVDAVEKLGNLGEKIGSWLYNHREQIAAAYANLEPPMH